jgi:hypothetical protein
MTDSGSGCISELLSLVLCFLLETDRKEVESST